MARKIIDYNPESIDGVIAVCNSDLYLKSAKSMGPLLKHLDDAGYVVEDISAKKGFDGLKPSRDIQEKKGWQLWHGDLRKDVSEIKAECGSCGCLINRNRVETHNHKCEKCGAVTFIEYSRGDQIQFSLADDDTAKYKGITLLIHSYDDKEKRLNFFLDYKDFNGKINPIEKTYFGLSMQESYSLFPGIIKDFPKTFRSGEVGKEKIVSIPLDSNNPYVQRHSINTIKSCIGKMNFKEFKLFNGKKYDLWDHLPVPEDVSIYEAWHWAPLKPSPELYKEIMHAAGQVPRKDFYHQDGRPGFGKVPIERMLKFIEHFTTLDADKIRPHLPYDISGPDLIDILAKKTGHDAQIETAPNVFIALSGIAKAYSGEELTANEKIQVEKSIKHDLQGKKEIPQIIGAIIKDKRKN